MRGSTNGRPRARQSGGGTTVAAVAAALVVLGVVVYTVTPGDETQDKRPSRTPATSPGARPAAEPEVRPAPEPAPVVEAEIPAVEEARLVAAPPAPTPEPAKVWVEVEHGVGHTATQDKPQASNGKHVGWFGQGKRVTLSYELARAVEHARLYLRYGRGDKKAPGALEVAITGPDGQKRTVGMIALEFTGAWDRHAWTSMALGPLGAGTWQVTLTCASKDGSGDLDVTVLIDDRWDGLWQPTDRFENGRRVGEGGVRSPFALKIEPTAFRGVFEPGRPVGFDVEATNRTAKARTMKLSWQVLDYEGLDVHRSSSADVRLDPGQTSSTRIEVAPRLDRGWYAILFDDGAGGSPHRYVACMEPTARKDRANSRFGLNDHGMKDEDAEYELAARLGVGWLRGLSLWHLVQKGDNREQKWQDRPYRWEAADKRLALAQKYGIERMGSFAFSVAWASSTDPYHKNWWGQSLHPPDDLTQSGPYATYVKKLVARYKTKVRYWEHWNEPEASFFKSAPGQYVDVLACATKAARSVDPRAIVLNGGYANIGVSNVQRMLEKRIGDHHHITAIHGYNNTFIKVWPLKRVYKRAGQEDEQVWNTETGREPSLSEKEPLEKKVPWMRGQAEEVVRTFSKNIMSGVDRVFWFCYAWEPYAMFTDNGPRPSAMAYRTLSDLIDTPKPAKLVGTLDLGANARGVFALVYKRADGAAIVVWREAKPPSSERGAASDTITIPVDRGARTYVTGVDGRDLGIAPDGAKLTVPARVEPTLVRISGPTRGVMSKVGWAERYPGPVRASITFTDGAPESNGIYVGGHTLTKEVAGKRCAATGKHEARSDGDKYYLRVDLADDLLWEMCDTYGIPKRPVKIRLTYFDRGTGPVGIQYAERDTKLVRGNTMTWKTKALDLPDPGFPNQGCHCDFRLTSWAWGGADDIEIHKIEIVQER